MVSRSRLSAVVVLSLLFAATALLTTAPPSLGQVGKKKKGIDLTPPPPVSGNPATLATQFSAIKLVENDEFQQFLNLGRECVEGKVWDRAVLTLQLILNHKEDFYAQVKRADPITGEERVRSTSMKYEANRLLGSMPREGLEVYEQAVGSEARNMLAEAKRTGNRELLADVAHRFMHTRAGAEANDLLATTFLDRGQFFTAALRFDRLIQDERLKANDLILFKAAFAYRRAGDADNAERVWKLLEPRLVRAGGLKLGEQLVTPAQVRAALDKIPAAPAANPHDWIMVGGQLDRAAQAKGSPPLLDEILFSRKTVLDKNDESGDTDRGTNARVWIDDALKRMRELNAPIMPGFFPIAAGKKLIYRTYNGVAAVNLEDVKDEKGEVIAKAGSIEWKSTDFDGALATILEDPSTRPTIDNWLRQVYYPSGFVNLVYENSAVGTLSTDHRLVYTVDDLAVPAPPTYLTPQHWNSPQVADKVKPLVKGNSLQAFELDSGKIAFRLGDPTGKSSDEFSGSHFLGVPVVVGGRLYVLNEKNDGQLRLMCLEPRRDGDRGWKAVVVPPVQVLGTIAEHHRVTHDIARRATTVHLAYGEGILVCPTNAGEILGVDLMSRTLAWSYPYRQAPPNPQALSQGPQYQPPNRIMALTYANWKVSPPFIVGGKVVFTAPDASSVHCINLRDGTPAWVARQQDHDLFLAGVFDGKVVIVGKNSVRFLRLSDGQPIGEPLATGDLPSGQGVASNNIYYLPLRKGEILAIDISRGQVKARNRAAKAGTPPGNLVFYEGAVLSQTHDEVIAYPQLTARLARADKALEKDPASLALRTERGEYLLRDGQIHKAVDDLRTVWLKKPDGDLGKRVRNSLYDAFTDLMLVDFKNAREKYLNEYRELCDTTEDKNERDQRQARFLRILGQGLEGEGNLVDAFTAYREFGSLPLFDQGIPMVEDPRQKIPRHVWLRGRVMAMLANATPREREPLEAKIAQEWKAVEAKQDVEAIRSFVGMFDVPFQVGREARLKLAETIIDRREPANYLEAELYLHQLRVPGLTEDARVGGAALEALARLEIKKGSPESMRQALAYYRELAERFPDTPVRDGKTGKQLLDRALEAKTFLPFLGKDEALWTKAEIKGREVPPIPHANIPPSLQGFLFQPAGELTPFMQQHRLLLDPVNSSNPILRVLDTATNTVRGQPISLGNVSTNYMFFRHLYEQAERNNAYFPDARFRFYQGKGHLAVFQVGTMVYGLDLANAKLLWSHSLLEANQVQPGMSLQPDAQGNLWLLVNDQFGRQTTRTQIGRVGAVQASYVAVTSQKGLQVLDPLRGGVMWSKQNVPSSAEIFGDDKYIYVVNTSSSGITGPAWVLRAADGSTVEARDFTYPYQHMVREMGGRLLVADPAGGKLTLRLYDVVGGKDLWKQAFEPKSAVLKTEDPNLAGVIEPNGQMTVVDLRTQQVLLNGVSVLQAKVTPDDIKDLKDPLLLEDGERFYVALNQAVDQNQVAGGVLSNNFGNGLRCHVVNGWFLAFDRKGEFLWHPMEKTTNQMIVLEQFRRLPVLLFSARYTQQIQGGRGGARMVSWTGSIDKATGKMVYWPTEPAASNGSARFYGFTIDVKAGTINMYGYSGIVQHYLDDGRQPGKDDRGALPPGGQPGQPGQPGAGGQPGLPGGPPMLPPGGIQRPKLPPRINIQPPMAPPAGADEARLRELVRQLEEQLRRQQQLPRPGLERPDR